MMTGGFQSAKREDMKVFQASVPDFCYEYEKTEEIAGYEVYHIGEGVYMFCELIGLEECARLKLKETYPDLQFIVYGPQGSVWRKNGGELRRQLLRREGEDYKLLLFVVSKKYKRHDKYTIKDALLNEAERFDIRREHQEIIEEFINQNHRVEEESRMGDRMEDREWVVYEPLENFLCEYVDKVYVERADGSITYYFPNRADHEKGSCNKITGKLGFRYEPDKYEKVNGWVPYFLCDGRIGKYVYPGIYHFEDSLRLPLYENNVLREEEKRIFPLLDVDNAIPPLDFDYAATCWDSSFGDTWYCCLGVEEWSGGSFSVLEGSCARYICLDRQSEPVLRKMSEFLVDYKFGVKSQGGREWVCLDELLSGCQEKCNEEAAEYVIEDNAVELVDGYGFRDLTVLCSTIFKNESPDLRGYRKYDFAYVLGDYLILVTQGKGQRLEVPLKVVSTLKVKGVCDLGAGISENVAVTVLDRRESLEREFLGEEAYERYIRCIKTCM